MMVRSIEGGRWTATFRPGRRVRILGGGFFALWLLVWAVGEAFGVGVLLAALGVRAGPRFLSAFASLGASLAPLLKERVAWREIPGPQNSGPLALAFIGSWLAIWTMAGLMAAYHAARLWASEDRVMWDGAGVEIRRRLGPFRTRREWRADRIEHVSLSRADRALLLHTPRATHVLTQWGSKKERAAVREEIRRVLGTEKRAAEPAGPAVPSGWVVSPIDDGGMLLVRDRRGRAWAAWGATAAFAAGAVFAWWRGQLGGTPGDGEAGAFRALLALLVLAAGVAASVWLTLGGTRIAVREGAIEFRPGPLAGRSIATFDNVALTVEHTTDDDGDDWFELQARSGGQRRTIERHMNESRNIIRLARWIAERSGAPLDLGRGVEDGDEHREAAA